jgi:hypothetical protein
MKAQVTFAVGIPHTPWVPERAASMDRLIRDLGMPLSREMVCAKLFQEREPNWSWSQKLWGWACSTGATHLLQIQDDVIVGPEFWPTLLAMVEAKPDDVIGLESVLGIGTQWYSTSDGLIGVAYVVPIRLLRDFITWRSTELRADGYKLLNEDTLLGLWCFVTGRRILHPSVTIVDHDTELASSYGNDRHSHRRPSRTTTRGDAAPESWDGEPFPAGRFYASTPRLARRYVKGYGWERMQLDMARQS